MFRVCFLGILLLCFVSQSSIAQMNIKIGYNPSYGQYQRVNDLFAQYNAENGSLLQSPYGELNFMHGLELGLRYRFGSLGIDAGWSSMTRNRSALLYFSSSDSFASDKYNFSIKAFSISIDQYYGRFGIGSGIYSQKLNISREIGNNNLRLAAERQFALDFHLNLMVQNSNVVSFVIRPYYRFSLGDYSLEQFAEDLNGSSSSNDFSDMNFFGLKLIFYNGKQ